VYKQASIIRIKKLKGMLYAKRPKEINICVNKLLIQIGGCSFMLPISKELGMI
jgi:hypothetical protein